MAGLCGPSEGTGESNGVVSAQVHQWGNGAENGKECRKHVLWRCGEKRNKGDTVENTEIHSLFFVALFQSGACAECISLPAELTPASCHVFRLENLSYVSLSLEH